MAIQRSVVRMSSVLGVAALAMTTAHAATATKDKPKPTAAQTGPQATDETFGDWTVSCREIANAGKSCEATQNFFLKGQQAPYGRVAVSRPKAAGEMLLTFAVPVNVNLSQPIAAGLDTAAKGALELKWTRCVPGACFAQGPVARGIVEKWAAAEKPPSAFYVTGAGQKFTLGFSPNGFKQAMAALLGG
ncbi:MAG: invasion associated locus B family protein [Hyphomicrobiales bacterium]|nr:invasion associated locus B family protein [Hyphomicrobiales bacterium]MDE2016089.1 invasion associated locus B family protein [Hyphomicrobiales bacterium]